jgi:hypothetical protein
MPMSKPMPNPKMTIIGSMIRFSRPVRALSNLLGFSNQVGEESPAEESSSELRG